ncbi:nickel pincer cofactor biosynthesis protein LarC [Dehalococcoidia bacterium]|nr:nickel pincer cofactor biosynthesis protein LarC [Dehalococcoidia bacterium]
MKIAYFDCFSGISGDMVLGALVDLGVGVRELSSELDKLRLSVPYELKAKKVEKHGICGTKIDVALHQEDEARKLVDILRIIGGSALAEEIKGPARKIFVRLAEAEARIHQEDLSEVHFHELGGLDAIIDIVGAVAGMKLLGIDAVYGSPLRLGHGFVKCRHGTLPIPAPATLELTKGVPVYGGDVDAELVTPTGAAIITTLAQGFGELPEMKIEKIGYGAGKRNLPIPNLLRVLIGVRGSHRVHRELRGNEICDLGVLCGYDEDTVTVVETNIDDMNPEFYEYIMSRLFESGAVDVYLTPTQMKQVRPATLLSAVVSSENLRPVLEVIFRETTTLGVRTYQTKRYKLAREEIVVETEYGEVRVKLGRLKGEVVNLAPEHRDCRRLADELGIPIKQIYEAARGAAATGECNIEDQRDTAEAQER